MDEKLQDFLVEELAKRPILLKDKAELDNAKPGTFYLTEKGVLCQKVDEKWLVDSMRVGELLDYDSYTIGNDLRPQSFKPRLPLLRGLQFGIIGDRDTSAFKAENGLPSQLKLQTKPMTTQQVSLSKSLMT